MTRFYSFLICSIFFALSACSSTNDNAHRDIAESKSTQSEADNPFDERPVVKVIEHNDPTFGTLFLETVDIHDPANRGVTAKISVLCKDQKAIKSTLKPPKKELLVTARSLCEASANYDSKTRVLTVTFKEDDGEGDSYEELCTVISTQTFHFEQLCEKWTPRN